MTTVSPERPVLRSIVALVSAVGLGAGGLLVGFLLTLLVGGILVVGAGIDLSPTMAIVLSLVFVQGIGCGGVALSYVKLRPHVQPPYRDFLGLSDGTVPFQIPISVPGLRDMGIVVAGYIVALGGAKLGSVLVAQLPVETGTNQAAEMGLQNPEVLLLLIPASILLIGPGEELLFRGVVQGRVREVFGPVIGVLVPSIVFAFLHWFALTGGSLTGNLIALSVLVVPALVFGASYEYTDNIVVPALIHGAYNATLFSILYVTVAYADRLPAAAVVP